MPRVISRITAVLCLLVYCAALCGCSSCSVKTVNPVESKLYNEECAELVEKAAFEAGLRLYKKGEKIDVPAPLFIKRSDYDYIIAVRGGFVYVISDNKEDINSFCILYGRHNGTEPMIKCQNIDLTLFSKLVRIYSGIELGADFFDKLLNRSDSVWLAQNKFDFERKIRPKGTLGRTGPILGQVRYTMFDNWDEEIEYTGYKGCCIENLDGGIKY